MSRRRPAGQVSGGDSTTADVKKRLATFTSTANAADERAEIDATFGDDRLVDGGPAGGGGDR